MTHAKPTDRAPAAFIAALQNAGTPTVSDALDRLGLPAARMG